MTLICDPDCVGELAKCCYTSVMPMGLKALPFSFKTLIAIPFLFFYFMWKDAIKGLLLLPVIGSIGLLIPIDKIWVFIKKKAKGGRK